MNSGKYISQSETVGSHYEAELDERGLLFSLRPMLEELPTNETGDQQLAALDHFHVRGPTATVELAQLAGVQQGWHVLDAGSGLGGPSRYLAQAYNCLVTGFDLSPAFVEVATYLAARGGLSASVHYHVGDIAHLPVADQSADLVWTEHVAMNLADRDALYAEFYRVLRPDGRLAFYDPVAVDGKTVEYPVPWAANSSESNLLNKVETIAALHRAGLQVREWRDVSQMAKAAFAQQSTNAPGTVGLGLVMGPRFAEMAKNFATNVFEDRLHLVMGVAEKVVR